jgi:hypothetical protein
MREFKERGIWGLTLYIMLKMQKGNLCSGSLGGMLYDLLSKIKVG